MKVFAISHSMVIPANRPFFEELGKLVELKVLVPRNWTQKNLLPSPKNFKLVQGTVLLSPHIFRYFFISGKIFDVLRLRPDIVYIEEEPGSFSAMQAMAWGKITGAKIAVKSCENLYREGRFPLNVFEKIVLGNTDLLICLTKGVEEVFRKKGFKGKTEIIGLGVEAAKKGNSRDAIRKKHGISKFAIGYFGRMVREKSIETLIEAAAMLKFDFQIVLDMHEDSNISFVDKQYKEELLALAKKLGVEKKIVFVSPSYQEMGSYLSAMYLLALPSKTTKGWKEQFGRVLIEAMIAKTPAVGSSSGSIPEIIGDAGLVFSEGNAKELAEKISMVYGDANLRKELVRKGLKRAEEFSLEKIAEKTARAFSNLLGK